jgi:hypothetical protein
MPGLDAGDLGQEHVEPCSAARTGMYAGRLDLLEDDVDDIAQGLDEVALFLAQLGGRSSAGASRFPA